MGTAVSGRQAFHIEVSTLTTDYSPTLKTTLKVLLTTMALSWFATLLEPPIMDKDRVETLQSVFDMYIRSDPKPKKSFELQVSRPDPLALPSLKRKRV